MSARTKDMTVGRPFSLIIGFALPLMAGNIFQQLYTVVDTAVVGKALGVDALAALGACDWYNWMILGIIQGITQGFSILMAQEFGAKRHDKLRTVVGNSIILAAICAAVLLVLAQICTNPVLTVMKTPAEIKPMGLLYLRYIFAGIPIVMSYNLFAAILRALGDGKTPLYAMIIASLINIVLDLLFVLVFNWGIPGAAIATLIAQMFSAVFCLYHILRIEVLCLNRSHFELSWRMTGRLFVLGLPMALQNAIIAIGGMIVQFVVNKCGVLFIAGYTASNKLYGILEVAAISYGYSMTTYVGQNLGAKRIDRIRKGVFTANIIGTVTAICIGIIMIVFGKYILSMFISGTPDETAEVLRIAYYYLCLMSVCLPILYFLHIFRSSIQGLGNTFMPMASGIAEFVMRISAVLILPALVGNYGIFWSEVLAWTGADVVLIISYFVIITKLSKICINAKRP